MSSMTELTTLSRMESPRGCRSHRLPRGAYLRTPLGSQAIQGEGSRRASKSSWCTPQQPSRLAGERSSDSGAAIAARRAARRVRGAVSDDDRCLAAFFAAT